jgi:2-polyprenyl-3-methyl-5-hydroxy-6-metoxy-1,4-benzoquinol methylase
VWANPLPPGSSVRTYYSRDYRQDYKGTRVRTLPQIYHAGLGALARYRELREFLTPGSTILDVGCGGGELVYILRRLGYDARGVEPDTVYSEQARRDLGLPVQTGFVEDIDLPDRTLNVVLMYHVLEHVAAPVALLSRLRRSLADAGFLVVEVPNIEARREAPMTRFHVAHLHYFNPDTLSAVARAAGFGVHRMSVSEDGGTVTGIFTPQPASDPPQPSPETYRRITGILRAHSNRAYYLSRTPYVRMRERLRTYWRKRTTAARFGSGKDILESLVAGISPRSERQ